MSTCMHIASPASSATTCVGSESFYSCDSRSASSAKSCLAISATYLMREALKPQSACTFIGHAHSQGPGHVHTHVGKGT